MQEENDSLLKQQEKTAMVIILRIPPCTALSLWQLMETREWMYSLSLWNCVVFLYGIGVCFIRVNHTLYRKFETIFPRNENARPCSHFLHSCICGANPPSPISSTRISRGPSTSLYLQLVREQIKYMVFPMDRYTESRSLHLMLLRSTHLLTAGLRQRLSNAYSSPGRFVGLKSEKNI